MLCYGRLNRAGWAGAGARKDAHLRRPGSLRGKDAGVELSLGNVKLKL